MDEQELPVRGLPPRPRHGRGVMGTVPQLGTSAQHHPRPQQRVQGSSLSCFLLPPLPQTLLVPPAPQRGQLSATAPGQERSTAHFICAHKLIGTGQSPQALVISHAKK